MQTMQIKRQKQIQAFLVETFGEAKGTALFHKQEQTLYALIDGEKGKTENQMKSLTQTIFPSVALYKALLTDCTSQADAYATMRTYMLNRVAAEKHASTAKMEIVPGFYKLYSKIFLKIMRGSDAWESTQKRSRDSFDVTITKCLWHTACEEHGCPELCRLFCDADNVTYGRLRKIGFARTQTLGCGGECCDFHFFKK